MTETHIHTVRGLTGTIPELMRAFGVQVGASTVYMRHCKYGWSWERCLLYRGRKPPLNADNPAPVVRMGAVITPWEIATDLAKRRYGCCLNGALLALVTAGYSRSRIANHLGLTITPQHYRGLRDKAAKIRRSLELSNE